MGKDDRSPESRSHQSIAFFENQFRRQTREGEFQLNPFESLALDHVRGDVLDLGCGLGNLTLEAARRGCRVTAVDAAPTGVERIRTVAAAESLAVEVRVADLETWAIERPYDTVVAIGLLMFFRKERALALLDQIREHIRPGGRTIVNVLVEGTTYFDMFQSDSYYLFGREELRIRFSDWRLVLWRADSFAAPRGTIKAFTTIVAEKPLESRPLPE